MKYFAEIRLVFRFQFVFKTMFKTVFKTMFETMFKTMFETVFKTMFKTMFKTKLKPCWKKNRANKNMSFLKLTNPKKRDFTVNEFLKTRHNIQQNFLSERVSDLSTQYELSKALQTSYGHAKRFKRRSCKRIETN